jgi:hypothetical protein
MIRTLIADLAAKKVDLKVEGDRLIVDGPESEVTDSLVERLRLFKPGLMRALSGSPISRDAGIEAGKSEEKALKQGSAACPVIDEWTCEDWRAFFDERAGIAEFDAELPRPQAEAQAFECCVVEWLNRNAERSPPGRCLGCGGVEDCHPLLPIGVDSAGHAWIHSECWEAWRTARRAEAVVALSILGIVNRRGENTWAS